ncbi:tetratricopeptide repeat protein [Actinomadura terrae]|uniref:tetratricopeptide repeat protein n=1 Tax=Actinomadura terrae TaxID=604353 RepID=UPI0027DF81E0|nr:tetratricopeptide repeat protein [Actinomadura terrae]
MTAGVPEVVQRVGRPVEMLQPSGTFNPGDRFVGDRYLVSLGQGAPVGAGDGPWGGLSGGALFSGDGEDLLVGVIAADPAGFGHGRLEAVPAYVLHGDEGFRAVLAEHTGRTAVALEPVEWAGLADTSELAPPGGFSGSPAELLRARREVAPFRGRDELMAWLRSWAQSGAGVAAWLGHGPGGQGKTRLAARLAAELSAAGWAVLWLHRDAVDVRGLADAAAPLLLIVDYAETRPRQVVAVAEALARHSGGSAVRVVLLARTADDWWQQLQDDSPVAERMLEGAPVTRLPVVDAAAEGRREAYRQAVTAFAAQLPAVSGAVGLRGVDWAALAQQLQAPAMAGEVSALTVQMRALADLLDAAADQQAIRPDTDAGIDGEEGVEDRLLFHERRYWLKVADARGLTSVLGRETLTDALAASVLVGAADDDEADDVLSRVPGLTDQPRDVQDRVRGWIAALYPAAPPRPWDTLQPDRLAERFIGRRLQKRPGLAESLAQGCSPQQATRMLTVYARAAAHPALSRVLNAHLTRLCTGHPDELAAAAIQAAPQVEKPAPLLEALRQITDDPVVSVDRLATLADELPHSSHTLAEYAAHLAQRLTDHYRARADKDPEGPLPDLATSLNNLAVRLGDLGRQEEGLEAIIEAVQIRRRLVEQRPDSFLPDLAMSLNNLAIRFGAMGRREEGLEVVGEAVQIRRRLAEQRPDAFLPVLASSLNNQAIQLGDLGRREEGLEAIVEAVQVYRRLAEQRPDSFLPHLAMSLNNLAIRFGAMGRREEGLEVISEAVQIRRRLAEQRPAVHRSELESSEQVKAWLETLSDS